MNERTIERFWSYVDRSHGTLLCWEWLAGRFTRKGGAKSYGCFACDGKTRSAHKLAYELTIGPVPDGAVLRHKCDNILCCNPSHMETGTHADNVADRVARGRNGDTRGERSGAAKLTEAQVRHILSVPKTRGSGVALATLYGVTGSCICEIRKGRHWKDVHETLPDQF